VEKLIVVMANSLVSLLGRLETAVARLEGVIGLPGAPVQAAAIPNAPVLGPIPTAPVLGPIPTAPSLVLPPAVPVTRDSPLVSAFEAIVLTKLPILEAAGQALGSPITEATAAFIEGMRLSGRILRLSETCRKPTAEELKAEVYPKMQEAIGKVSRLKDKHSPSYNHIAAVEEGVRAIQWPVIVGVT
jgi:hypothetical protein